MHERAKNLTAAIKSSTATESTEVYRGLAMRKEDVDALKPGATFADKGFCSTSVDRQVAENFATKNSRNSGGKQKVVIRVQVEKGDHILDVSKHVDTPNSRLEQEALLGANTTFEVVSSVKVRSFREVTVRIKRGT